MFLTENIASNSFSGLHVYDNSLCVSVLLRKGDLRELNLSTE